MSERAPDTELFERLGHEFRDVGLLATALTHASAAFERDGTRGNERLEFLGDAVLDLVVARLLFTLHPDWREGELTRARSAVVNTGFLARQARGLGLPEYLVLGRTERRSGGADKERVLANLFEAVIGALYLDAGLPPVFALVERCFGEALTGDATLERDPKTRFQEWAHAERRETPRYVVLDDSAVEEAEDRFRVAVTLDGEVWAEGSGRSKRAAERAAAVAALARLEDPHG
ncbi:MAG: ribonuclease III [Myxococcota bacterium]